MMEEALDQKTAMLIQLQRVTMDGSVDGRIGDGASEARMYPPHEKYQVVFGEGAGKLGERESQTLLTASEKVLEK